MFDGEASWVFFHEAERCSWKQPERAEGVFFRHLELSTALRCPLLFIQYLQCITTALNVPSWRDFDWLRGSGSTRIHAVHDTR